MARYRSRETVQAVKWDGHNDAAVQELFPDAIVRRDTFDEDLLPRLLIESPQQDNVYVAAGEYVVRHPDYGAAGTFDATSWESGWEEVGDE